MGTDAYNQAVAIASDYLGPAAERFINRQVAFHLKKGPKDFTIADIPPLAEWVKVSISILTEDQHMVDEFSNRIAELVEG